MNMQPSTTGLLLGAGASFELGMPLALHLTKELRDFLTRNLPKLAAGWRRQGAECDEVVVKSVLDSISCEELDYEAVLGHVQIMAQRTRQERAPQYGHMFGWLVETVYFLF